MVEIVSEESVAAIAGELGLDAEAVLARVGGEVEFRLRQLVQDAAKFMRRSRRQKLTTKDINHALKVRGWPLLHGFGVSEPDKFKFLQYQNIFFLEEEDVDMNKIMEESEKMFLPKKIPLRPNFGIHWLAVNGVQPTIAENPNIHHPDSLNETNNEGSGGKVDKRSVTDPTSFVKNDMAKHRLSRELQIYYEKVVFAVIDSALGNRGPAESVYTSLAVDPGLQPLMPYLSKFIFDQVNKSLCNLPLLNSVMRLTRCILINPNLDKELYLHQMMPPILTCIVHRKLCASPFMDHWALRNFAASLIPLIYTQFGETYKDIKPRITKTLRAALLSKDRPMTTQYGAIVGISAMGPLTVQAILLPVMRKLLIRYNKVMRMNGGASPSVLKCLEAQHCIGALQTAFGSFIRACSSPILSKAILLEEHLEPAQVAAAVAGEPILSWAPAENTSSELQLFI